MNILTCREREREREREKREGEEGKDADIQRNDEGKGTER